MLPQQHPDLASFFNNVGAAYGELGESSKALEYQLQALCIWKYVLPDQHPTLATSFHNVGWTYSDLDLYDKAL